MENLTEKYIRRLMGDEPEVPILQSIIFPNGEILNFDIVSNQTKKQDCIIISQKTTIDNYFENNNYEDVSYCHYTNSTENSEYIVSSGEGSWGGDGIISVTKKLDSRLMWLLFSDQANPFYKVEIKDDVIIASSTSGKLWTIPINSPEKLKIRT